MSAFKNPDWINSQLQNYTQLSEVPEEIYTEISNRLRKIISDEPVVTVSIAAWNEELNIIRCLNSLSFSETSIPFEIIVVNNNSTDRTQEVLDKIEVQSCIQTIQGCGPTREMGQQKAKGNYILLADADCLYPKKWIDIMYKNLTKNNTAVVYGRHAFLGSESIPRWQYSLYEVGRRALQEIRHLKHPYLNSYGMTMGYPKELGLKEGFITTNMGGMDGRMCFDLMKYGRVRFVRSSKCCIWTEERNFSKEGGFRKVLYNHFLRELTRFEGYFKKPKDHDTKTSKNSGGSSEEYIERLKTRYIKKDKTKA